MNKGGLITNRELTIDDLTQWILENRKNKVFKGWTTGDIHRTLQIAFGSKLASYTVDQHGNLCGVVILEKTDKPNTLYCSNILTTKPGVLKILWTKFMEWYGPEYTLTARRHGSYVTYNVDRLHKKLKIA